MVLVRTFHPLLLAQLTGRKMYLGTKGTVYWEFMGGIMIGLDYIPLPNALTVMLATIMQLLPSIIGRRVLILIQHTGLHTEARTNYTESHIDMNRNNYNNKYPLLFYRIKINKPTQCLVADPQKY